MRGREWNNSKYLRKEKEKEHGIGSTNRWKIKR